MAQRIDRWTDRHTDRYVETDEGKDCRTGRWRDERTGPFSHRWKLSLAEGQPGRRQSCQTAGGEAKGPLRRPQDQRALL